MSHEKRVVRRIDNRFGVELIAEFGLNGSIFRCPVNDYNSIGISVKVDLSKISLNDNTENYLDFFRCSYGNQIVCEIQSPRIIDYYASDMKLIVSLKDRKKDFSARDSERADLSITTQGSLVGVDPYAIDQALFFRIVNISHSGFRMLTSKSNRHITPGLQFINYDLVLPGYGAHKVDFQICGSSSENEHLMFSCQFLKKSKELSKQIDKILLTRKNLNIPFDKIDEGLKSRIKKVKKFGSNIRVRRVSSPAEYEQVLRIRFKAYREAQKTKADQTWKDMADSYDKNAIIYAAFVGNNLVATLRLVFRTEENKLPFEEYLSLSDVKDFDPTSSAEVSRFAIDPHFQGTDLFFVLFRKIIYEIGAKKIVSPVCMATSKLAPYYRGIGAIQIAPSVPHPTIQDEVLTLYLFKPSSVRNGKMSALGWYFVASPAIQLLRKFGFVDKPTHAHLNLIKIVPEIIWSVVRKYIHKLRKEYNALNPKKKIEPTVESETINKVS